MNEFTVGHFWKLHLKNTPRLAGLAEDSAEVINEKKAFYSGAMAALGFSKLSVDLREEQKKDVLREAVDAIVPSEAATTARAHAGEAISKALTDATTNISELGEKIDILTDETRHELFRLKNTIPAPVRWWNRFIKARNN